MGSISRISCEMCCLNYNFSLKQRECECVCVNECVRATVSVNITILLTPTDHCILSVIALW